MANAAERVYSLIEETVKQQGVTLWDVRFLKEGANWYLRVFIDSEKGIGIDDCTNVSHAIDPIIDEADPIDEAYTFEVSSAGAERELKRPSDFEKFIGSYVAVKLYSAKGGSKEHLGNLVAYSEENGVEIEENGKKCVYAKSEVAQVRLRIKF